MDSLESLGDCPSETRTTSAVLAFDIVIGRYVQLQEI
jgi:hypothetical protein